MTAKARLLKICASDPRPSAKGIGVVLGIGVLVVIISSIVLLDLPNLINAVKSKKQWKEFPEFICWIWNIITAWQRYGTNLEQTILKRIGSKFV